MTAECNPPLVLAASLVGSTGEVAAPPPIVLQLYVSGMSPRSMQAISDLRRFVADQPAHRYDIEIVDIYQQPERAAAARVIAAPTLVKALPAPARRLIGSLADAAQVLRGLGLAG